MKPFQFYKAKNFPILDAPIHNSVQLTFLEGSTRNAYTTIKSKNTIYLQKFELVEIYHEMEKELIGITCISAENGGVRDINFTKILIPVNFEAYLNRNEKYLIINAPKDVCKSFYERLTKYMLTSIDLEEMKFDFAKAAPLITEYYGAWFKGISSKVHAAALFGREVQSDTHFIEFVKQGQLSNIQIPFLFSDISHRIMLTKKSAVVLIENYDNIEIELKLLTEVYVRLIKEVWGN